MTRTPLLVPCPDPWTTNELLTLVGATVRCYETRNGTRRREVRLDGCLLDCRTPEEVYPWLESIGAVRRLNRGETKALGEALGRAWGGGS